MQKDTRLLLVLHLESLFRYSKTYWSEKEKKDQWNACSLNDVGHCQTKRERLTCTAWPGTMNTAQNNRKPQTLGPIDKNQCQVVDPNTDLPCWLKTPTSIHITDFKKSPYPSQPPTPSALWKQNTTLLRTNTSIPPVEKDKIIFKMAFLRWCVGSQGGYLHPSNVHRASRALEKALWFDRCHKVCSPLPLRVGSDSVKMCGIYSCCDLVTHKS